MTAIEWEEKEREQRWRVQAVRQKEERYACNRGEEKDRSGKVLQKCRLVKTEVQARRILEDVI